MIDYALARLNMVNGQLLTNGIHDKALVDAYLRTPREMLVDAAIAPRAYMDEDIAITGTNRWVLEPLVEARMIQTALAGGSLGSVLVLGAASLPSVEMLAAFARHVLVIEPDRGLAAAAGQRLARPNVNVIETAYREGYVKQAPYDVIFVGGAVAAVPSALAGQLAIGGRLVAVLREKPTACGRIIVMHRLAEDAFDTISMGDASTPYLAGFEPEVRFTF